MWSVTAAAEDGIVFGYVTGVCQNSHSVWSVTVAAEDGIMFGYIMSLECLVIT